MEDQSKKLWTKEFVILSCVNFFITLIFFLLIVTIGSYAVTRFNASTSMAGLVASIFIVGALIGRLTAGNMMLKLGNRKMLVIGLLLFLLSTVLYVVTINLPLLIVNRLFHGFALGVASTALGTIVAQAIPYERKGEGIGYYSLSSILSTAIGPFVGMLLTQHFEYLVIFLLNIVCAFVCLSLLFFVKVEEKEVKLVARGFSLDQYIEKTAVPISFVALIIGFSYSGILSFLTFYVEERDVVAAGSYFFIVYACIVLLTRPFTGKLFDQRGANIVMYPCILLFAFGMLIFSFANSSFLLLLSAVLIGIGYGNFNSVAQAIAIKVTPPDRIALATSTYFIFFDVGLGFGPYLLGFFISSSGYSSIFQAMVIVIVLAFVTYYVLYGRKEKQQPI